MRAVGPDGLVVAATESGVLYAITNGVLDWHFPDPNSDPFVSSPAISRDGVVVIGSEDGWVYGITNGSVKWSCQTGNALVSSPAISPYTGAVIIASEDGNVYSLAGVQGLATNAPWPMFHHDVGHSGAVPNPVCSGGADIVAFPNNPSWVSGTFSFYLSGPPGSNCSVYFSSDLINWASIGSVTLNSYGTTPFPFSDSFVTGVSTRFYMAHSASACSPVIGFMNLALAPGSNLVANPFYQVNDSYTPQNTPQWLSDYMPPNGYTLPDQTEIAKWNGTGFASDTWVLAYNNWQPNGDLTLLPGEAVFITSSTNVTLPFAGLVPEGVLTNSIVAGTNFISSLLPLGGRIQSDLGYQPHNGDVVQLWSNGMGFTCYTNTNGAWKPSEPILTAGQGLVLVAAENNLWVQTNLPCSGNFILTPVWSANLSLVDPNNPNTLSIDASPAIGSNGIVYILTTDNDLFAINPTSGAVLWSDTNSVNTYPDAVTSSPTISQDDSTIYFGTQNGFLVAVTNLLVQGVTEWSNYLGAPIPSSPALLGNSSLFVGTDAPNDGTPCGIWGVLTNGSVLSNFSELATNLADVDSSPSIGADSTIYFLKGVGGVPLHFCAFSTNGSVTWAFPVTDSEPSPSPAIDSDGTIYSSGLGNYLYAINPDGSIKWAFDSAPVVGESFDFYLSSPVIGPDHTVYVGSETRLFAVTNGMLRWAFPDPRSGTTVYFESTPVIDAAGTVYAGGMDGNFYAIGGDGQLESVFPASAPIISSAVIGTNKVIYFASTDGVVHALGIASGPATNAPWPMFRQNARHTGVQASGPALAHASGAPFPYNAALDGVGDFSFAYVGLPGTTWTVYGATNLVNWSSNSTFTVSAGAGLQTSSFSAAIGSLTNNGFFFMKSNDWCSKAVGFVQVTLQAGTNLITDPLAQIDSSVGETIAPNTLQSLMNPSNGAFNGVAVEVWNGQGMDTYTNNGTNWYLNGNLDGDGPLRPGASALVISTNTSPIPLAFVGLVRDGVYVAGADYVTNYITSPTNYLASILPLAGGLSTDLHFPASHGDRVQLWSNGTTLTTYTYTNTGGGTNWTWRPSEPVLGMGQGFILTTTNVNNAWVQSEAPCYGQ